VVTTYQQYAAPQSAENELPKARDIVHGIRGRRTNKVAMLSVSEHERRPDLKQTASLNTNVLYLIVLILLPVA